MYAAGTVASIYPGALVMDAIYTLAFANNPQASVTAISYSDVQTEFKGIRGMLLLRADAVNGWLYASGGDFGYRTAFSSDIYQSLDSGGFNLVYDNGTARAYFKP